jgi:hypothetical protein
MPPGAAQHAAGSPHRMLSVANVNLWYKNVRLKQLKDQQANNPLLTTPFHYH